VLIVGAVASGYLSRPSWFGDDDPARLAAPPALTFESISAPPESAAVLFIVDKSGSMSYDPLGGTSKIEMAKEALRSAVQALPVGHRIGILVFNDQQEWVVPMTAIEGQGTRDNISSAIDTITADGGTEIFPALSVGYDAIGRVEADVRHIVLLSDGKSRTGTRESYQSLIAGASGDRVILSTIAIGDDADTDLLQFLAEQGGGRYHVAERASDIPAAVMLMVRSLPGVGVATPSASPAPSPEASPARTGRT
jgi:Mg-chelatase subunit ChlD